MEAIDGFIDNERFESKRRQGWVLSLSTWRDEKAVVRWRSQSEHHKIQEQGRNGIFSDYHLRVCEVTADSHPPAGMQMVEQRLDASEIGEAKALAITEVSPASDATCFPAHPDLLPSHLRVRRAGRRTDRIRSVPRASLQQQLSASSLADVKLRGYFIRLSESIAASMIRDHSRLSLEVVCDDSIVSPDISISLGLIVTELVINALKHAFPGGRRGTITIDYRAHGPNWTLSASDDGVGMPLDSRSAKPGLGTSIIKRSLRN